MVTKHLRANGVSTELLMEKDPVSSSNPTKLDTSLNNMFPDWIHFYDKKKSLWKWSVIKKMRYFDLSGFNPKSKSEKEKGIFRFKQKRGGNRNDYWILRSKK